MRPLALVVPLLVGCQGTLKVEGIEPFGPLWSAIWIEYVDVSGQPDDLQLTNVPDACEKLTAYYAAAEEASALFVDDPTSAEWCARAREPYQVWATAADALVHEGAHYVDVSVFHAGGSGPIEASFRVGDDDRAFEGGILYVESNPYLTYLEDWDVASTPAEGCGVDGEAARGEVFFGELESGTLTLGNVEERVFAAGRIDAAFTDASVDSDDPVGTVEATFRANVCAVDAEF